MNGNPAPIVAQFPLMSNQPCVVTTRRTGNQKSTRRQFLRALGVGVVGGTVCVAAKDTSAEPQDEATLVSQHEIRTDNRVARLQITIPRARYRRVTDAEHSFSETFAAARSQSYLTPVMAEIARRTPDRASAIRAAQSLTARITYISDEASTGEFEYVRYPAETLVDECGDCEDKAILLAGLLSRSPLNCRTALLIVPHHCATLVAREDVPSELLVADPISVTLDGIKYVYVEAVGTVRPGEAARDYGSRPHVAAYDGRWTVLDTGVLLEWAEKVVDRRGLGIVGDVPI